MSITCYRTTIHERGRSLNFVLIHLKHTRRTVPRRMTSSFESLGACFALSYVETERRDNTAEKLGSALLSGQDQEKMA